MDGWVLLGYGRLGYVHVCEDGWVWMVRVWQTGIYVCMWYCYGIADWGTYMYVVLLESGRLGYVHVCGTVRVLQTPVCTCVWFC